MEADIEKIDKPRANWKRLFSFVIRVIIGTVILYFIISLVQWENVLIAYNASNGRFILIGGILLFFNIGIRTYKWHVMLNSVKNMPTYSEAFGSLMLGISLGSFTPAEIGEYAGRALHIANAKRSHLVGLALLDKAQIFIITCVFGLTSLLFLTLHSYFLSVSISICVLLPLLYLFFNMRLIASVGHFLNTSLFKRSLIAKILDGFTLLTRKQVFASFWLTILFHCVVVLQMFFLINAFNGITLYHAFIGTSIMMFVKSFFPISFGDLGVREASSIFIFSIYGIPDAASLNASLLLFVINILIPSLIGVYFLKHHKLSTSLIKKLLNKKIDSDTK
jgi:uncharacterized membrane protein YbhN (UPF0104 family)